jgi:hypothetical protein
MVLPYLKGLIVIKEILHIVLVYLLWCFCIQSLVLNRTPSEFLPFLYGPYTITKVVGNNYFELNIPPFIGLHLVFNVDLLRPYFPPLLDTSDVE